MMVCSGCNDVLAEVVDVMHDVGVCVGEIYQLSYESPV